MKAFKRGIFLVLTLGIGFSTNVDAWDQHHLITRGALEALPEVQKKKVRVTSIRALLEDFGYASHSEFNLDLKIHKKFRFKNRLGEQAEHLVSVVDVLSLYSDEPDWNMDNELFHDHQYPELWKDEYKYMGGKKGTPSQAFRHMYWPKPSVMHPMATFKLPLKKLFSAMGKAPERGKMFLILSRKAKELGHPYWSVRFLANALHYLQDVANPFHSTQTPTKKFYLMPLLDRKNGSGFKNYVKQGSNIIAYYHFAFEDYVRYLMMGDSQGRISKEGKVFFQALSYEDFSSKKLSFKDGKISSLIKNMAKLSLARAPKAGRAAIKFFPKINVPFVSLDPDKFMDESWWEKTIERGQSDSKYKRRYFNAVNAMFIPAGYSTRAIVKRELGL